MSYFVFFDIDHTILKVNSGAVLLRSAHKKGILSNRKLITAYWLSLLYRFRLVDPTLIIEKFATWLAHYPVRELENLCLEIVEQDLIPAIRPQIQIEIEKHRALGAHLVILSSSLEPICTPLAKYMGISMVICTILETEQQHYTGRPKGTFCYQQEKRIRMIQFLDANNSALKDSHYYGDSIDDLTVLQSVGHPVCVNPGKALAKIAREHNWEICVWE